MDFNPEGPANSGAEHHGLRFTNEDWNGSISNGQPFTLRWNESLEGIAAELGVFKVAYPRDGLVVYELVSNLTSSIDIAHCVWTPERLADELYALWLSTKSDTDPNWTMSPVWRPKQIEDSHEFQWAAPVGIPIVVILGLYALGVFTCLMYRRKKRRERAAREGPQDAAGRHLSANRHPSVDSAATLSDPEDPEDPDGARKHEAWFFMDSAVEARRPSDSTVSTASMDRASEDTIVESHPLHANVHLGPSRADLRQEARRLALREIRENRRPESW